MVTVFTVTMFFSCQNNLKEVQGLGVLDSGPLSIAEELNAKHTDSGILKLVLVSPKMLDFTNRRFGFYEFPDGINLTLYDDDSNESHVVADYAIMYDDTNLIDLQGDVVLSTHNKDTLFAEQLFYDQGKEWLFTNQPVRFKTPTQLINGNGFDSNRNFTNAGVLEVTGVMTLEE